MTDFPDWQQPQAAATAISTTGVPLLRGTASLGHGSNQALATGLAAQLLTSVPVTQPSYEGLFSLFLPAGSGTTPFASLIFNWFDQVTALNVYSRFTVITAGNGPANALQVYLSGPCRGNQLSVSVTNLDSLNQMTLTWGINQTSHVYDHDRVIQPVYAQTAPVGFTNPGGTPGLGQLAATAPTISPGSSVPRLMAAYSGKAVLAVDNLGNANVCRVRLLDPGTLYSTVPNASFHSAAIAAASAETLEIALPDGPVILELHNSGGTGNITPAAVVTTLDY